MTAATLFSGIGAPEVAMPEWNWLWHAEIEKFPSAVMGVRHPDSVNLGDVTAHDFCDRALAVGRPDVLVFGSPCQAFSVAGKRLGLDDPRGNLALVALGIVARIKPAWFVFENVPGLLSSADGRDFGLFLRTVDELGARLVWSVLDAQYFGLAQRRKRVFAVGHLGADWRRPAAVLLEPEGLCGHPPTRGQARQDTAGTLATRTSAGGGLGTDFDLDVDTVDTLVIAHALRADAFDASEDGTGRGTPLVPVAYAIGSHAGTADGDVTNRSHAKGGPVGLNISEELGYAVRAGRPPAIAFSTKDHGADSQVELSPTLRSGNHDKSHANGGCMPAVTVALRGREGGGTAELGGDVATAMRASQGGADKPYVLQSGVRRLMPIECERLQGFPDNYTAITYRGKPAADGPRYKAIGNSMAVPVVRWILSRVEAVQAAPLPPEPDAP